LVQSEKDGITPEEFESLTVGALRKAALDGNIEEGSFLCGAIAGMVGEIKPASEIISEIFAKAQDLLKL
jgi:enoyl-[acyl-carrier protein] reductase II